ncbi:hypothetical protein [Pandoraea eparura]|jgi:hypothetical protein|uniref:hypothetical protein n=1 Tax=Pandoraea eparura TaxID=2508291 RepID=UPI001242BC01|nr:hypothetical protein [Pandoraea eparura]
MFTVLTVAPFLRIRVFARADPRHGGVRRARDVAMHRFDSKKGQRHPWHIATVRASSHFSSAALAP